MKNLVRLFGLLVLLALVLSACGAPTPAATQPPATEAPATEPPAPTEAPATEAPATEAPATEAPAGEPFRVAVVMPSAINDLAFSQSIYDALVRVQEEMGGESAFEIVYSENMFVVDDAAA